MEKSTLIARMNSEFDALIEWIRAHPDEKFEFSPRDGKWTTGQHISHLLKSAQGVNQVMQMPREALAAQFGKMNRPERNYDELRKRYMSRLQHQGQVPASPFRTGVIPVADKSKLIEDLDAAQKQYVRHLSSWDEAAMSEYIVPHPLLGKLSIREMGNFFAIHTADHLNILKRDYA